MTTAESFRGIYTFRCEECGLHYVGRGKAVECEKHCRHARACSTKITEESIERTHD